MTHSPYAIVAERAIFLLSEMEDGAEQIFFFLFLTNRPNAPFESSNFRSLPPALLLENHNKLVPLEIQTHGKMSTFMRLITFVPWLSGFLTDAVSHHSKPHLKCRSTSVRRGVLTALYCLCMNCHFDLSALTADYVFF